MLRGINRQLIFEDDEDRSKFLDLLCRFKKECGFELSGYCLMGNHVHLLIKENAVPLERIIKKIGTAYVYYFNQKNDRVGHLFQDRFRSEVVHDDPQLLQTLRYIHRNPVKAILEDYRYCRKAAETTDGSGSKGNHDFCLWESICCRISDIREKRKGRVSCQAKGKRPFYHTDQPAYRCKQNNYFTGLRKME